MRMLKFILAVTFSTSAYSLINPIVPSDVLTKEEIAEISQNNNYFLFKDLDDTTPVWMKTRRKYANHYFKDHTHYYNMDEVVHKVLTDSFPVKYQAQAVYRAKLNIHSQIGNVVPQLNLSVGEGLSPLSVSNLFSGLFNFLQPANWMRIPSSIKAYKSAEYLLAKAALDQVLLAKTTYISMHQLIQDLEMYNFYFIHLQLLAAKYPEKSREIAAIIGSFGAAGTDMATQRGAVKIGFDNLGQVMALEKLDQTFGANTLNIADITDFPKFVTDLPETDNPIYRDKELFVKEVIKQSIELKSTKELYEVAKLNIGITAFSNLITQPTTSTVDAQLSIHLGYGTLPAILTAKSLYKTARFDVQSQYINMLTTARQSFDYYINAVQGYTEAKRALAVNRESLKQNMDFINQGHEPDAIFLLTLQQMIKAELQLNNALHASLTARAYMDRFLLIENSDVFNYLPSKDELMKAFDLVKGEKMEELRRDSEMNQVMEKVKSTSDLETILYNHKDHPVLSKYSEEDILNAVKGNMESLLESKIGFYKHKTFFVLLHKYIDENNIKLTHDETYVLKQNEASFFKRYFLKNRRMKEMGVMENFDFEHLDQEPKNKDEL
jgi:hypothetical protein